MRRRPLRKRRSGDAKRSARKRSTYARRSGVPRVQDAATIILAVTIAVTEVANTGCIASASDRVHPGVTIPWKSRHVKGTETMTIGHRSGTSGRIEVGMQGMIIEKENGIGSVIDGGGMKMHERKDLMRENGSVGDSGLSLRELTSMSPIFLIPNIY